MTGQALAPVSRGRLTAALVAYTLAAVMVWTADLAHRDALGFVGRVLAMPALLVVWRTLRPRRSDGLPPTRSIARCVRLATLAVFFSWLGDLASFSLLVKLCLFLVAQACYVAAMSWWVRRAALRTHVGRPGRPRIRLGPAAAARLLFTVAVVAVLALAASTAGALGPAVVAYGLLVLAMALSATTVNAVAGTGAVLFVCSDTLIGLQAFVLPGGLGSADAMIMLTYLPAQLLIVLGVAWALRHDRASGPGGRG